MDAVISDFKRLVQVKNIQFDVIFGHYVFNA